MNAPGEPATRRFCTQASLAADQPGALNDVQWALPATVVEPIRLTEPGGHVRPAVGVGSWMVEVPFPE